ncbi:RrF2 family transcriptional regulator [[Clostridium] hylemonae]|uniref:RrF2 family transcriptional regulator n=1 Tax=[Clostridium] hylemonae TaxID=89153 RepID=UPI0011065E5D|nr:Rrf2 family transcriptional regulator [[Clostridium] hylemonae]
MTSEFAIAVHALVYLHHKDTVVSSEELAENICTNPARVRKVMAKLKKKALVGTKEGIKGGYHMAADASAVTLRRVCDALEEEVVKASWKSGSIDMDCMIASGMAGMMDGIYSEMNAQCKDYLETVTIEDVEKKVTGCPKKQKI